MVTLCPRNQRAIEKRAASFKLEILNLHLETFLRISSLVYLKKMPELNSRINVKLPKMILTTNINVNAC